MRTHRIRTVLGLLLTLATMLTSLIATSIQAGALSSSNAAVAVISTPSGAGYTIVARDGGVFNFGDSRFYGSMGGLPLNAPIVGGAVTPTGNGYTLFASDGGVFNFGDSKFYGSMGGQPLSKPIVGGAATPSGKGYVLFASDGGVFNFGDSKFYGSMGGQPLSKPIVGGAVTPTGKGYTLVAADGGIFNFGDSRFYGSMGGQPLSKPIVGMASTPTGNGYTLVAADGGIFNFGDSRFYGSMGGQPLSKPIVGMASTPTGNGYTLVAADGGIFNFGDSGFYGSVAGVGNTSPPVVGGKAGVAVATALAQLNKSYIWGATGPDTFDCSGLTQYSWKAAGISLPRTAAQQQASALTVPVAKSALVPGDLVFINWDGTGAAGIDHVVMYIGNNTIIEAHGKASTTKPTVGMVVRTMALDTRLQGARAYWTEHVNA